MSKARCIRPSRGILAMAVLLGIAALTPSALAQQPPVEFSTFRLFEGDSVDLNRDDFQRLAATIRKAQTPGSCPLGSLRIRVPEGDPQFQQALAAARRDAVLGELDRAGVPVAGRLFVETAMFGGPEGHDTVYQIPRDRTPPTLRTNSDPPKGSKVKPGQRIVVRMAARDDTGQWQTGVKTIQLVADSEGGRFIASENYEPCSDPKEKRVEATYTVPADPPPIVRLTALAEDHAGLMDTDTAEFPTGDFYGTFTYIGVSVAAVKSRASADIVLNHDGNGNLRGTMIGQHELMAATVNDCSWRPGQPNRFRVSLVGSYTEGRSLKVFIEDVVEDAGIKYELRCSGIPIPIALDRAFYPYAWGYKAFLGTPSPLGDGEVAADGVRQYKFGSEAGSGPAWTVTLHRARN